MSHTPMPARLCNSVVQYTLYSPWGTVIISLELNISVTLEARLVSYYNSFYFQLVPDTYNYLTPQLCAY